MTDGGEALDVRLTSGLRGVFVYDQPAAVTFNCGIGRWFLRSIGLPPPAPMSGVGP